MHLIVPFAGTVSEAGRHALQTLALPQLDKLLGRLTPGATLGSDEFSLNTPHELALAQAWGWQAATEGAAAGDGDSTKASTAASTSARARANANANASANANAALPFAAQAAATLGLAGAHSAAWGQLVPVHLNVGSEGISLTDPQALQLDEASSRELLAIVRELFESEGFALHWAAPLQWLVSHPSLDALPSASIDRVIGRNLAPWLPDQRAARLVRRLQNEAQMVLYTHAVNDRREAAGLPTVNSFWLSGCGRLPAAPAAPVALTLPTPAARPATSAARAAAAAMATHPALDDRLRGPALTEDWAAWCEAWRALDAGPIADLLRSAGNGVQLTLCGERLAQTWTLQPRSWWQQLSTGWRKPATHAVLEAL